jgi:nucleotide-binding universal stress UspA family protein
MYKRILVPLDGSELAELALPYAEELAEKLDSEVILLNVRSSGEDPDNPELRTYLSKTVAIVEQNMKKSGDAAPGQKLKVTSAIIGPSGFLTHAAEDITDYAEKEKISLIIMATHGRTGIKRWALGSTADKVVRAAKCPILLARTHIKVPRKIKLDKLLVTLDGSRLSETVLPHIESLAAKLKSQVILLHVVVPPYHIYPVAETAGYYSGSAIIRVPYSDKELKPLKEGAREYLRTISDKLTQMGISTSYKMRVGAAAEEIIELADELGVSLVAMSTCGESGFTRWEHGSVATKVLHAGNKPLLLIRERQDQKDLPA